MKKIFSLFLIMILFCGCKSNNLVNGEKKYIINTDCGRVQLTSTWIITKGAQVCLKPLDGKLVINADSTILKYPVPEKFLETRISYRKNLVKRERIKGSLLLKKGKELIYSIYIHVPIPRSSFEDFCKEYNKIHIAPNDFILCNGEPVITDTIRISRPPLPRRNSKP